MKRRSIVLLGLLLVLTAPAAWAQMGSHLKEEFSDPELHGVRIVESPSGLRSAISDPKTRIVCWQGLGTEPSEEQLDALLAWVREGGTVWFYDARQAPLFGMQPYLLLPDQFRHKPEKGVLGGKKRPGVATVGLSHGRHAVQTGVGQVTVFLPELPGPDGEGVGYGAVEVLGDTVPLLQFALDSPALGALRREGRGLIVFKTLLWNEPLSGDRYQLNLLEYSAGFQVPGPAGVGKIGDPPGPDAEYVEGEPAVPLMSTTGSVEGASRFTRPDSTERPVSGASEAGEWRVLLQNGDELLLDWIDERVQFESGTGSLNLEPARLQRLEIGTTTRLDEVELGDGRISKGVLLTNPLRFRNQTGGQERFDKESLVRLERIPSVDEEQE